MKKDGLIDPKPHIRNIIITALVILFVVGVIVVYYALLYSETRQNIMKTGEINAATSAEQIDQYLAKGTETMKLACFTLDSMIRSGKSQAEIRNYLVDQSDAIKNTTMESSTGMYGYFNGEYLDGTDWVPGEDYSPTQRPWYVAARANVGRVAVVDPYVDAQTGNVMITFAKTLCDVKSVAAMDYSIDPLQKITEEITSKEKSYVEIVLNSKYQVIAHSDKAQIGKNYIAEEGTLGKALVDKLRSSNEDYFSFEFNGDEYIVYKADVSNDWMCLSVLNADPALGRLRQMLLYTIIALLLVISILLFVMIRANIRHDQFAHLSVHVAEALAAAIDAKDAYTNGHSGRVAKYAAEISRRYGYSEKKQRYVYMMGLLHDVGKIGIPDAVINKPGRLTNEEYEIIKKHPAIGSNILSKAKEMPGLSTGAKYHHERIDGKGYPEGLAGKEIPEEARIIAVADAYDAMTSSRSYRDYLPQELVKEEIEKGKNTQFDPAFADIMIEMIEEDKNYEMRGLQ